MSKPKQPDPAMLVISCLMKDKRLIKEVFPFLEKEFGPVDMISRWFDFPYTGYYEKEMGSPLFRKVVVFKSLIHQEDLARIKEKTNAAEQGSSIGGKRRINLDPGYLLSSRFILATGKDYAHRIYIGRRIYADLALMYVKNQGFRALEWTYPDYASPEMTGFLTKVRNKYRLDLKAEKEKLP